MNLWLRLLSVIVAAFLRPKLNPASDASVLHFRVWPHDLDASLHMNNGRYWTLMDLGRADLVIRSGLWRAVLRNRWTPVVGAGEIRFRRELSLFRPFRIETRIAAWTDTFIVMEHRVLTRARDGSDILAAIALVRTALYDRRAKSYVPVARMLAEVGVQAAVSPAPSPAIAAFLAAEDALRQAA